MKVVIANMALGLGGGTDLVVLAAARALQAEGIDLELRSVEPTDWDAVSRIFPGESPIPEVSLLSRRGPASGTSGWASRVLKYRKLLRGSWNASTRSILLNLNGDIIPAPAHISYVYFPVAASTRWPTASPLRSSLANRFLSRLTGFENKRAFRSVRPRLLATSSFTQKVIREIWGMDSDVLFPPVRLRFPPPTTIHRENAVITVASFRARKRLERVLETARQVPEAHFYLLGASGPDARRIVGDLRQQAVALGITDRVSFYLDAGRDFLEGRYWGSKIYLHPTPHEHFGISTVEAMQAGCVPLVPRSGGQWTDVLGGQEGKWGYGYDTPNEAAELIRRLLVDEARWSEMSAQAQLRGRLFSPEKFAEGFLRVYREVAASVRW